MQSYNVNVVVLPATNSMEIFEWTAVQTSIINISQLSWWPDSDLPFRKTDIESLPTSFFNIGFQNIKTDIWKHHEQTVWSLTKKCHVSRRFFSARPLVAPPAFRAGSPPPAAGPGSPPVPVAPAVTPAVPQVPPGSPMPLGVLRSWENMENGWVFRAKICVVFNVFLSHGCYGNCWLTLFV